MSTLFKNIDTLHEAYLRKEFKCTKGPVKLTWFHPVRKFISSQTWWTKDKPQCNGGIELIIPPSADRHQELFYAYLQTEDERNIIDFIQAKFDLCLESFFIKGYRYNFQQKDIILAFITYYNLPLNFGI